MIFFFCMGSITACEKILANIPANKSVPNLYAYTFTLIFERTNKPHTNSSWLSTGIALHQTLAWMAILFFCSFFQLAFNLRLFWVLLFFVCLFSFWFQFSMVPGRSHYAGEGESKMVQRNEQGLQPPPPLLLELTLCFSLVFLLFLNEFIYPDHALLCSKPKLHASS